MTHLELADWFEVYGDAAEARRIRRFVAAKHAKIDRRVQTALKKYRKVYTPILWPTEPNSDDSPMVIC